MNDSKQKRRKIGGRPYKPYSEDVMQQCLKDIKEKRLSSRKAAETYGIPRSSILLKMKAVRENNEALPGRCCVFTFEEEESFLQHAIKLSEFGFPISTFDLRCIVKMYLDACGREELRFTANFPGKRWAESFVQRHRAALSQRFASNIKRSRAAVNKTIINSYFDNIEKELEGIPPENLYNYDETNLVDDPGKKKVLTKRGCKYPEAIKNSSKASVSVMMCGNAAGEILPPYVNYKAEKMWDTWTEGGPIGARYNRTKSGWFDATKVIIGDNLSSHISPRVIEMCERNDIIFICLPPNATHLTQPLDLSYFRPMKIYWRQILDDWKKTSFGRKYPTIPKDTFPLLLKKLVDKLANNGPTILKSGFRKSGLYPINRKEVLARLPNAELDSSLPLVSSSFIKHLESVRAQETVPSTIRRKRRLNAEPGKSIHATDISALSIDSDQQDKPGSSGISQKKKKSTNPEKIGTISSSDDDTVSYKSDTGDLSLSESEDGLTHPLKETEAYVPEVDDNVIVKYEEEYWPGVVTKVHKSGITVSCMARRGNFWKWPSQEDALHYSLSDIVCKIKPPTKVSSKRDLYNIPELKDKWGIVD